jgi:hypothetical protein
MASLKATMYELLALPLLAGTPALESPVAELHADDLALRSHPPRHAPDLRDRERADTVEVPEDFASSPETGRS